MHRKRETAQVEEKRLTTDMYNHKTKQADAEKALLEATAREEKQSLLETRLSELEKKSSSVVEAKQILSRELTTAERTLFSKEREYNEIRSEAAKIEQEKTSTVAKLRLDLSRLESSSNSLREMEQKALILSVMIVANEISDVQAEIQVKEDLIRELNPKIQSARSELEKSDRLKRLIVENLNLRVLKKEEVSLSNKLREVSEKAGGKDFVQEYSEALRRLQRAEQEKQKLLMMQAEKKGSIGEILNQISILESKLGSKPYKDIDEQHRMANIKYETTLLAVADLDSYFIALDRALQTYHSLKMKDINKTIRELWQQIYRGEDIDMIELVSGQDAAGDEGKAARSYNYRVMMYKGDTSLEMRGRCSAGQRVLASTVIRLALAETFCLNCGILALDEVCDDSIICISSLCPSRVEYKILSVLIFCSQLLTLTSQTNLGSQTH
jgi:DNA repair protein RAD50